MIVSPAAPIVPEVARLVCSQTGVSARLPGPNDKFRAVVKRLGYRWDSAAGRWTRVLDELSGPPTDRLLETAAALVRAGFMLDLEDGLAARLRAGDWQPERKCWVIAVGGRFGLRWRGQDENLYRRAQMLPDSAWDPDAKAVTVPALYFGEVFGFAEEHGFQVSQAAAELRNRAVEDYQRTLLPEPPAPEPAPAPRPRKRERYCNPLKFADLPYRRVETTTALLPHQVPAVAKLLPLKVGAFFMDMGTGKTRCAIELVTHRQQRISRVVWFCPVGLKLTIAAEIAKHTTGEPVCIFDDRINFHNIPDAFWYIVGIESMSSSDRVVLAVASLIDGQTFVIVDESSYIKGHASKRSMRIAELGKRAHYRLLLTGTPISQGVEDLYAQMRFLSPDILGYGSFYSFARHHLEYSERHPGLIVRSLGLDNLAAKLAPFVYQVTKADCLDLPDKLYDAVYCDLTHEQAEAYFQAKCEILAGALDQDEIPSYIIFQLFTVLQEIVSGYWRRDGETIELPHHRIEALLQVVSGIPEDCKVIIWCKHLYSLRQIAAVLPGAALYYGDLDEQARAAELARFRGPGCRFLVATTATGGHGLTLTEAHYAIFYENEFKYSHRIQAEDRCHRIGQTERVTYIDIVSDSGIDARIQKAIAKKEDAVKSFRREVKKVKDVRI